MQLDQTHIVIRRRSMLEILDLSIHVLRDHLWAFMILLGIGILPWMVFNYFLLNWMISGENEAAPGMSIVYWWVMFLLVASQSQIATAFVTKYLGDATFKLEPRIGSTISYVFRRLPNLLTLHFLIRPLLFVILVSLLVLTGEMDVVGFIAWFFLPGLAGILLVVRAARPFANEIVLLEQTPMKASHAGQVTYSQRTKSLHGSDAALVFGRSVGTWMATIPIFFILCGIVYGFQFTISMGAAWNWFWQAFMIPIGMWLTVGLVAVVRFLTYIDTRIYQEGWDVELKIRAEAIKFKERLS